MYSRTGKRSFRRACRRAIQQGSVVYRGRRLVSREAIQYYPSLQGIPGQRDGQTKLFGLHGADRACRMDSNSLFMPEPHGRTGFADGSIDNGKKTSKLSCRKRLGEARRAGRLCCYSWNVGGLTTALFEEILQWMTEFDVQVATLQETRWNFSGEWIEQGFSCFHSGTKKDRADGVLTIVKTSLAPIVYTRFAEIIPGRLLQVRVPRGQVSLDIINCYQYFCPDDANEERRHDHLRLWEMLDKTLSSCPLRNILMLSGDFNCSVHPWGSCVGAAVGVQRSHRHLPHHRRHVPPLPRHLHHRPRHLPPRRSCDELADKDFEMQCLQSIIQRHDLCLLNTWGSRESYTCIGPLGYTSMIDFIAVRAGYADLESKQVSFLYAHPLEPQTVARHIPLMTTIPIHWQCWKVFGRSLQIRHQLDMDRFARESQDGNGSYPELCAYLQDHLHLHHGLDLQPVLQAALLKYYAVSPLRTCARINKDRPARSTLTMRTWSLWNLLRKCRGRDLTRLFQAWSIVTALLRARREHCKARRLAKRAKIEDVLSRAGLAAEKGDQRELFKLVRLISPRAPRSRLQLRSSSGALQSEAAECEDISSFMRQQYYDENALPIQARFCNHLPFEEPQLLEQLIRIPVNKAVPGESVPGLCCKRLAHVYAPVLFHKLRNEWAGSIPAIPVPWCTSWLHFIPKPGRALQQMGGWRGISLQDPIGKAVLRTVVSSALPGLLPRLTAKPQFAYLKARSYREALLRVTLHIDRVLCRSRKAALTHHQLRQGMARQQLVGGIQICLDVDGAFDKVSRSALAASMDVLEIPANIAAILLGWHVSTPYRYKHGNNDIMVDANMGVRQGCVAAPLLWLVYTNVLLTALAMKMPSVWIRDMLTLFADDFHAAWEFQDVDGLLQALKQIHCLLDTLCNLGLKINMDKTQVLIHLRGIQAPNWRSKLLRTVKGKTVLRLPYGSRGGSEVWCLPVVAQCKYLGIMLSYTKVRDLSLRHRIRISWQRFHNLRPWWRTSALPLDRRIALWQCMIWPCLTHGIDVLGLTLKGKQLIRVCVLRQIRWIANSPSHIYRESNHKLLSRVGLCDPVVQMYSMCLRLWCRRWHSIAASSSSDILNRIVHVTRRDWQVECVEGFARQWLEECASWAKWVIQGQNLSGQIDSVWLPSGFRSYAKDLAAILDSLGLSWTILRLPLANRWKKVRPTLIPLFSANTVEESASIKWPTDCTCVAHMASLKIKLLSTKVGTLWMECQDAHTVGRSSARCKH